jgi:septal ring factor EnvC (AmiA/AmiB activator)
MSDLKKYLKENREIFDVYEPLDGHFERFEKRLNSIDAGKKTLKIKFITTLSAAAAILLIVAAGIWFFTNPGNNPEQYFSEFAETEIFYRRQIDEQLAAIRCKLDKADEETRNQLEEDLQSMTKDNSEFLEEIRNRKNEELAIYYLVEHYNASLETLRFINDKLGEYFNC